MKLIVISTLALLIAAFCQAQKWMPNSEDVIKELDKKLANALIKGDAASVDAILGDNYTEITSQGRVRSKSEIMAEVRMRATVPISKSVGPEISDDTTLHVYGDTAILIGLRTTTYQQMDYQTLPQGGQTPAPAAANQERFTKVYAKVGGRWQLLAFQTTVIPQSSRTISSTST
jgi:hypothetical protein